MGFCRKIYRKPLLCKGTPPEDWKRTKLTVIFKKNDPKLPGNYRPIAIISILYKLFSRMLCNRMTEFSMKKQDVAQAVHRKGFSTEDHLLTISLLVEKSSEFNFPIWLGLVDFEKAFDTVEHPALWETLRKQGVPEHYIFLLDVLYAGQEAYVQTAVRSEAFPIRRGVKQGDPLSALLFIAVMQQCFTELQQKWGRANIKRKGLPFGVLLEQHGDYFTNLRFADDVILIAQQRSDIKKMLADLTTVSSKYGLKLHYGKTKVMTWRSLVKPPSSILVGTNDIEILDQAAAERYLGRKFCFEDSQMIELKNRLAAGWAAFHKHKGELCNKFYSLRDRIRLFDAVVTPAVLYGSAAWALTQSMEQKLTTTRRRMLRYVFRLHRGFAPDSDDQLEGWVDFVRRTAHRVDTISQTHCMQDWIISYRRRKWRFAGKIARCQDKRWSHLIVSWLPNSGLGRGRGAPKTRWSDQLVKFAGSDWMQVAADEQVWQASEDIFAAWNGK